MSTEKKSRLKTGWPLFGLLSLAVVVVVLGVAAVAYSAASGESVDRMPTFTVRRGPLTISVVQAGTIQAMEQAIIKSEVEGQTTIIYLIPEGTLVEEGELLVELEASKLEDDLVEQQIRVQNAEAAFIRAREELEVVKNQTKSDISKAELDYRFAQEDLKQYVEGEYPQQLKEADSRIKLAQQKLELADAKLVWSERLFKEKFISQNDLETDRLASNSAMLDHELAVGSKQLLKEYTNERELDQLKSDIEQAQMALERVQLKAGADIVQAQADLNAKKAEFNQQQSKLEKVTRQIANTKIHAPRAGLVVYATSAQSSHRGNDEPLDEGQSVRERQELIYLPTADEMVAELEIHESNLDKVRLGLPVRVTVDALKGKAFFGQVTKIAPLPNAFRMRWNPDLKVYVTQVRIDGKHRDLRTGMSCQAEIVIDQYDEATYVPVQAVVREGNQPVVYVRSRDGVQKAPVEIGLDNNRMVRIVSGLEEGQQVLLTPPLGAPTVLDEERVATGPDAEQFRQRVEESNRSAAREPQDAGRGAGEREPGREERAADERRAGERGRFANLSPEEREAMRQRFENMTPEEREAARERRRQMQQRQPHSDDG
jgi:HlyD family secretion protein